MNTWYYKEAYGLISIIIPVYNEEAHIQKLLENVKLLNDQCEILFVDGGSTDHTVDLIGSTFTVLHAPEKGRAAQMNYGAKQSTGNILLFLHADSQIHESAPANIIRVLKAGYKVGCFPIQFDSESFLMAICGIMSNMRVRYRNIAFGDQGIFIDKAYFHQLGGFKIIPLMEDYQLSMDVKKDGKKIKLAQCPIITSERRFIKNGRLKTMWRMQKLQHLYRQGCNIDIIAQMYESNES